MTPSESSWSSGSHKIMKKKKQKLPSIWKNTQKIPIFNRKYGWCMHMHSVIIENFT